MSGYPDAAALAAWMGTTDSSRQTICVNAARGMFERETGRIFVAQTATKTFPVKRHVSRSGMRLLWGQDLATVTTITNGDGVVLAAGEYDLLLPMGGFTNSSNAYVAFPSYGLEVRPYAGKFLWDGGSSTPISIAGAWGYSATDPPGDVYEWILEMAAQMYRSLLSGGGAPVGVVQGVGVLVPPQAMTDAQKMVVDQYKRRSV